MPVCKSADLIHSQEAIAANSDTDLRIESEYRAASVIHSTKPQLVLIVRIGKHEVEHRHNVIMFEGVQDLFAPIEADASLIAADANQLKSFVNEKGNENDVSSVDCLDVKSANLDLICRFMFNSDIDILLDYSRERIKHNYSWLAI